MKKVLLHYPEWNNRWIPYVENALSGFELVVFNRPANGDFNIDDLRMLSREADVLVSMWCDGITALWSHEFPDKKIVSYLRRYELWESRISETGMINWPAIDCLVFVADYCKKAFDYVIAGKPKSTCVIPNGVDLSDFNFRSSPARSKKIAMVCSIKNVKNIPLAAQILLELPNEYKIHHVGIPFNSQIAGQVFSYIHSLGLSDRFIHEGYTNNIAEWLMDKDFILSTSINEGNPNNIIEAMAMGIKPVIHAWPGAKDQFPDENVFITPSTAASMIMSDSYFPQKYRDFVVKNYSLANFDRLTQIIKEL